MQIGDSINAWTLLAIEGPKGGTYVVRCSCGSIQRKMRVHVLTGHAKSCSRRCRMLNANPNLKYGAKVNGKIVDPTYHSWQGMKNRCRNANQNGWHNYGGRGISYDPRWERFEAFLADMGSRPAGLTLERKDNNGNYTKDNCCWANRPTQRRNSRSCLLDIDKVKEIRYSTTEGFALANKFGVSIHTIRNIRARRSWKEV